MFTTERTILSSIRKMPCVLEAGACLGRFQSDAEKDVKSIQEV
jgi:hypothetical protein